MLNRAIMKEAQKFNCCKLVPFPTEVGLDSMGQVRPEDLPRLMKNFGVGMVLQTKIEHTTDRNDFYSEIIVTETGDIGASFHQDCECPVGELLSWMVPEAIRKLSLTLKLKVPYCPPGTVSISASVIPGSQEPDSTSNAWGSGNFCMDTYEYPNKPGKIPVVAKTWQEANGLCIAKGKRLCSEAEWELACSGNERWAYPYGPSYEKGPCNTQSQTIQLSGGNPGCKSPYGAFDLSGNVYEWTSSDWNEKVKDKVVKGGNWNSGAENSKCQERFGQKVEESSQAIGLRCCSSPRH
jgi:hypothetical protein